MAIEFKDVAGKWAWHADMTPERRANIEGRLVPAVSRLMNIAAADGVSFRKNPKTGTVVSGDTLGGFRPQVCTVGAPHSNHKQGLAVDLYDPAGEIDAWCLNNLDALADCGIWIESPDDTAGWSHWQCIGPRSGRRVFNP